MSWLALLLLPTKVGAQQQPSDALKLVGKPIPRFKLASTKGGVILDSELSGKVVLLDFWASWAPPTKAANRVAQAMNVKYGGRGLKVIGVDCFEDKALDSPAKRSAAEHLSYEMTTVNNRVAQTFGISTIPTEILVDRKGIVRRVWTALPTGGESQLMKELDASIAPLLKG